MPVTSTHPEYDAASARWARARDVLAGEDAIKAGGAKYVARLEGQSDEEFAAYVQRASFFNATARTSESYQGLIFRRPPFVKLAGQPEEGGSKSEVRSPKADGAQGGADRPVLGNALGGAQRSARPTGVGRALAEFANDTDLLGTSLTAYAKMVVGDVIGVGRAGTLVDWEEAAEERAYAVFYRAEQIINWRVERVNGRNVPVLVVLRETASWDGEGARPANEGDEYAPAMVEQLRVLRLEIDEQGRTLYRVEVWREGEMTRNWLRWGTPGGKREWELVETRVPRRLGKVLPLIPFVFHGPRHSRPDIDPGPLEHILAVNLDHYRLDADFKHGLHFTALPTAWVSGFDKETPLRIGSSSAWVTDVPGAMAGYLEYKGQGLMTFERALDGAQQKMTVLGSRMLEEAKRVGETATAIELRQSGEYSILSSVAFSVSESLTRVLQWVYWWNSTEEKPEEVGADRVLFTLNSDFSAKGLSSQDLQSIVAAWESGAISRDTMFDLFRRGEVLPEGRTNDEEARLVEAGSPKSEVRSAKAVGGTNNNGAVASRAVVE